MQVLYSYKGMWWTIQADLTSIQRINFNWVALLFGLFAVSPSCISEEESRKYYLQALTARRLAEDLLSASFLSPRETTATYSGTAYGCIAASLMCKYLCDRGQMTEVRTSPTRSDRRQSHWYLGLEADRVGITSRTELRPSSEPVLDQMERHDERGTSLEIYRVPYVCLSGPVSGRSFFLDIRGLKQSFD